MQLLLTSGGVTNASIRDALVELLRKPIGQSTALCIPTAQWGHPMCGPVSARGFVTGLPPWGGMAALGWRSLGLLELTALPTIGAERWVPWVRDVAPAQRVRRAHRLRLRVPSRPWSSAWLSRGPGELGGRRLHDGCDPRHAQHAGAA
jgi:hypothetical protein